MPRSYFWRQLGVAALAANATRPLKGQLTAIPAFAAGWLTSELAPQLLALSAADTAAELFYRPRRHGTAPDRAGLALAALGGGALAMIVARSLRSGALVESHLREELGSDYLDRLENPLSPQQLSTSVREVLRPFKLSRPDVEVIRDLNYRPGGSRARLDIYRSADRPSEKAPVLIQIHGGGWTIGDKSQQGLMLMNQLAERGWVCVAPNYRLAPKHPFPAQIIDVKQAIAWVREHIAEYGGDPDYLVLTGGSAGGHLAALAALTPGLAEYQPGFEDADTSVAGCVPFYGVYDMAGLSGERWSVGMRDQFLAKRVFKKDPIKDLAAFELASPLTHVSGESPDFFVLHGRNDTLVNVGQARLFVEKLREQSTATVTYAELPGAQHAFEVFGSIRSTQVIRAAVRWLAWHRSVTGGSGSTAAGDFDVNADSSEPATE